MLGWIITLALTLVAAAYNLVRAPKLIAVTT